MSAVELANIILDLERRIEQLDRRLNNMFREARIVELDGENGLAKVEAHGLKSTWSPWLERAGKFRSWTPPAKDERVVFISPTGEPGQGLILPGGYSSQFSAPSKSTDENVLAVGDLTITNTDAKAVISFKDGGRCVVKKETAKLRIGGTYVVVRKGQIIMSQEPIIGADPDPD